MGHIMTLHEFDLEIIRKKDIKLLAGVDEAGRGPLAGPVCAAAVILPEDFFSEEINDSKKLTEKKREKLYDVIIENALSYSIAFADVDYIEENNILQATFYAMKKAVEGLKYAPDYVLVDGNKTQGIDIPTECVIGGDAKSQSIAAASILAKVTRDRYCLDVLDKEYPEYCFSKHKGYGTKLHTEKILEFGPCKEHRMSFLKKILGYKK